MPEKECQTEISFTVTGCVNFVHVPIYAIDWNDEWEDVEWVESSSDDYSDTSTSDETQDENIASASSELQYDRAWPPFPQDYFGNLGNKHCRWGCPKSYKYEVKALPMTGSESWRAFAHDWVVPRFNL